MADDDNDDAKRGAAFLQGMEEMPLSEFAAKAEATEAEAIAKAEETSRAYVLLVAVPLAAWATLWYSLAFLAGTLVEKLHRGYRDARPKQPDDPPAMLFDADDTTTEEGK